MTRQFLSRLAMAVVLLLSGAWAEAAIAPVEIGLGPFSYEIHPNAINDNRQVVGFGRDNSGGFAGPPGVFLDRRDRHHGYRGPCGI